jgi:hypothetical protein
MTSDTTQIVERLQSAIWKLLLSATSVDADVRNEADDAMKQAVARIEALGTALGDIESFTNGYGDVAGVVCRMAAKALRPESFIADTAPQGSQP